MKATLALENGIWYEGESAGAAGETTGEVVFNTSMTGYQEVLTDPSYAGQIVTMTCPEIGNYGVADEDGESRAPKVAGFVMRESSPIASNWRADGTLRDYLVGHNIVAISDIDTRALTRILRSAGVMRGVIATGEVDPRVLIDRAQAVTPMEGSDLVLGVTCERAFDWKPETSPSDEFAPPPQRNPRRPLKIAAYDFGMKWNILRRFTAYGCDVRVFPATAPASDLLAAKPDGVFLSNGPGDPAALGYAIRNASDLVKSEVPVFGICLGHQILSLALGGTHVQVEVRTPRRESSGEGSGVRQGGNHLAEPRLCRRSRVAPIRRRRHAPEPVRRHDRGVASQNEAGLLRAVPSGGCARPARRGLPVPSVHRRNGKRADRPLRSGVS